MSKLSKRVDEIETCMVGIYGVAGTIEKQIDKMNRRSSLSKDAMWFKIESMETKFGLLLDHIDCEVATIREHKKLVKKTTKGTK